MTYKVSYIATKTVAINPDNYATEEAVREAIIEEAQREAGFGFDSKTATIEIVK